MPFILGERYGPDDDIGTGSLEGDLRKVQRRQRRMFTDPVVLRGLPGWLATVDVDPERGRLFVAGFLAPRRAYTSVILTRAEARGEIPGGWVPDWISDVLSGPLITRAMLPEMPPVDELLVEQTVQAALQALGTGVVAAAPVSAPTPRASGEPVSG